MIFKKKRERKPNELIHAYDIRLPDDVLNLKYMHPVHTYYDKWSWKYIISHNFLNYVVIEWFRIQNHLDRRSFLNK